ncbi:MAG: hypothetical protein ACRCTE_10865 [Cellulosilyticaceae bacterium]
MYHIYYDYLQNYLQAQLDAYYIKYHNLQSSPLIIERCSSVFYNSSSGGKFWPNAQLVISYTNTETGATEKQSIPLDFNLRQTLYQANHDVLQNMFKVLGLIAKQNCFPLTIHYTSGGTTTSNMPCFVNQQALSLAAMQEVLAYEIIDNDADAHNGLFDASTPNKLNAAIILSLQEKIQSIACYSDWENITIHEVF